MEWTEMEQRHTTCYEINLTSYEINLATSYEIRFRVFQWYFRVYTIDKILSLPTLESVLVNIGSTK